MKLLRRVSLGVHEEGPVSADDLTHYMEATAAWRERAEKAEAMVNSLKTDSGLAMLCIMRDFPLPEERLAWQSALRAVEERAEKAERDLAAARETNARLQRRCHSAESGLAAKLESGPSFGRALANSAATLYRERARAAEEREKRLREAVAELMRVVNESPSAIATAKAVWNARKLATAALSGSASGGPDEDELS